MIIKNRFYGLYAVFFICLIVFWVSSCSCQGSDDWEHRHNAYQPPEQVMDSIGVEAGMTVAEVGAGRGRYVVHMAKRVGDKGMIYANDISKKKLDYLDFRCERDAIKNVKTVLGEVTDPLLPSKKLDLVYIVNTYHHIDKPVELMRNIAPSLKESGQLVIIEHDPVKLPNAGSHATAKEVLLNEAEMAGYELIKIQTFLERDNIYFLKPKLVNLK
jgi:ubiquinone/menaquinone biosynthesis C-methylase UbiE